jgi:hypothetical protein
MSTNGINEVFNAFVEAQKAMQRLPEAEADLARAKGELAVTYNRLDAAWAEGDRLNGKIAEVSTALSDSEAALRDATFREQQLRDKLEMLLGAFKGVIGEASAAVELVEPKPEPVAEVTSEPEPASDANETAGGMSPSTSHDSTEWKHDFYSPEHEAGVTIPDPTNRYSDGVNPGTPLPGTFPWQKSPGVGEVPTSSDATPVTEASAGSTARSDFQHGSNYNEGATVTPPSHPTPVDSTTGTTTTSESSDDSNQSSPPTPRPYWEKPSNITWFDWRAAGNDIPLWCRHSSDDQLKSIFN